MKLRKFSTESIHNCGKVCVNKVLNGNINMIHCFIPFPQVRGKVSTMCTDCVFNVYRMLL